MTEVFEDLDQPICVIDQSARVRASNVAFRRWCSLRLEGRWDVPSRALFLDALDESECVELVRDGLTSVLDGSRDRFSAVVDCHRLQGEEWRRLVVFAAHDGQQRVAVVQLYDVTVELQHRRAQGVALEAPRARLARSESDVRSALVRSVAEHAAWPLALEWVPAGDRVSAAWSQPPLAEAQSLDLTPMTLSVLARDAHGRRRAVYASLDESEREALARVFPDGPDFRAGLAVPSADLQKGCIVFYALRDAPPDQGFVRLVERILHESAVAGIRLRRDEMRSGAGLVEKAAASDATVLLLGESGVGKTRLARQIHRMSARGHRTFLDLNCAGLGPSLLESELFGHERGAFTGATQRKPGLFELASGGTVFLDEIGELDPIVQAKLLKVLETRRVRRLGGQTEQQVDVRFMAATNRDLGAEVRAGRFREDLYYRLNVVEIHISPLRERPAEIEVIAEEVLRSISGTSGQSLRFGHGALGILLGYDWPGNVRELRNVLERAALGTDGEIGIRELRQVLPRTTSGSGIRKVPPSLVEHTRQHVLDVLEQTGFNVRRAATLLGIARSTLYEWARREDVDISALRATRRRGPT